LSTDISERSSRFRVTQKIRLQKVLFGSDFSRKPEGLSFSGLRFPDIQRVRVSRHHRIPGRIR